jgi:hypothetical protein
MSSIIKLKRSLAPTSVPATLQEGELAVNLYDKKLFIGGQNGGANVQIISGDQYNFTSQDTGNSAVLTLTVDNETLSNDAISIVPSAGLTVAESDGTVTLGISKIATNQVEDGAITLGTKTSGDYVQSITGTADEIAVSGTGVGADVQIGLPNDVTVTNDLLVGGNTAISGSLQVDGDLNVEGSVTYISSATVNIDDSMLKLSANNVADTVDHGVYAAYVEGGTTKFAGYFRDSSDDSTFKFYTDLEVEPTTTVNEAGAGYTLAKIDAVIDGGFY